MYARVAPYRWSGPGQANEVYGTIADRVAPALRSIPGFAGHLNLFDEVSGRGVSITLFETATQAEAAASFGAAGELSAAAEALGVAFDGATTYEVLEQI